MITKEQHDTIRELRDCGCAVTIFQPEEMRGVDPEMVEEVLVVEGNNAIDELSQE